MDNQEPRWVRDAMAAANAVQDQEIAAARDWLDASLSTPVGRMRVVYLFDAINEVKLGVIRGAVPGKPKERLNDKELTVLCALAGIGMAAAVESSQNKEEGGNA